MRKILIINRLGIGDVVLTTPLAQTIKENIEAQVGYIVAAKSANILENHPYIDDVFGYSKKDKKKIVNKIKEKGYSEAIIVDERLTSTLLAWQAGCKLINRGFEITIGNKRLLKRQNHSKKAIDDFLSYSKLLGIEPDYNNSKAIVGDISQEKKDKINKWLKQIKQQTEKIVLVIPRTASNNKNWNVNYLGQFNKYLNDKNILPIYIGSKDDYKYIEAIAGKKINIAGMFTLCDLPILAQNADFALSMCTGPLHIIATTGIPIIAIYGPSDPDRWAPRNAIVVQSTLPCVPCLKWTGCIRTVGATCMDRILPERIKKVIQDNNLL